MKFIGLTVLFLLTITYSHSQEAENNVNRSYSLRSSVFSIGGYSNTIVFNNKTFNVSHSIGQSGVIGTFAKKDYTLRQGFQQPLLNLKNDILNNYSLNLVIYPNPFNQFLNISFKERIKTEIKILVYDLAGKPVEFKKYKASQLIYLPIRNLPNATYLINVTANNKRFSTKLIKQ